MLFFSKASQHSELLMQGANKLNLCQAKGSYLFGKQHSPALEMLRVMLLQFPLWQTSGACGKTQKTHLSPYFLSIFGRDLPEFEFGTQGWSLGSTSDTATCAQSLPTGVTPQGKVCL